MIQKINYPKTQPKLDSVLKFYSPSLNQNLQGKVIDTYFERDLKTWEATVRLEGREVEIQQQNEGHWQLLD